MRPSKVLSTRVIFKTGRSLVFCLLLLTLLASAPMLHAATVVRSVQSGTVTVAAGTTATTVTINSVTTANAFLVFGVTANDTRESNYGVSGNITAATTLSFTRSANNTAVTVQWYVIEFSSGVTVQRGVATIA